jgi:hypothetical protein
LTALGFFFSRKVINKRQGRPGQSSNILEIGEKTMKNFLKDNPGLPLIILFVVAVVSSLLAILTNEDPATIIGVGLIVFFVGCLGCRAFKKIFKKD